MLIHYLSFFEPKLSFLMKRLFPNPVLLAFIVFAPMSFLKAQTTPINVVTTAVPFLRISPDARAGGMGDVGIASNPDANSAFWNAAKIPFASNTTGVTVNYTPWLKDLGLNDVYLASIGGYHQLDDVQSLSASIRYFSLGNIQFTNAAGYNLNSYNPREFSIDFGYSRKLAEKIAIGVTVRYINSSLASGSYEGVTYKAGSAVAGDISVYSDGGGKQGEGFSWGAVLSNLGTKIGYTTDGLSKSYIPANLGLGVAYTKAFDDFNVITFGLDINKLLVPAPPTTTDSAAMYDYNNQNVISSWFKSFGNSGGLKTFQASLGAEYVYDGQFAVRAGYFYEDQSQGGRQYFTAGLGLKYDVAGINLSYLIPSGSGVTRNPLSNTLRFGLTFDLGKSKVKQ